MNRFPFFFIWLLFFGSCTFTQRIKDGEQAYTYKKYAIAHDLLLHEFESSDEQTILARKAFLIGDCNLQLLQYGDAEKWFEIAVAKGYNDAALSKLALSQKMQQKYSLAIENYKKLGEISGRKQETQREVLICQQALTSIKQKSGYEVQRLSNNSLVSEYSPSIYDAEFIVYTSEGDQASGNKLYDWTGQNFTDILIMPTDGSASRPFDAAINTPENEGSAIFSSDMKRMYFNRCFSFENEDARCKIMVSYRTEDIWSESEVLPFILPEYQYKHPALIEKDSVLIFASDLSEPGGNLDLYYSILDQDGTWSQPEPLSSNINTPGNELFPTSDGDTLYFSTDYLPSLGGLDIYMTFLRNGDTWANPIALPFPINSSGDDFGFTVDRRMRVNGVISQGFFTSSRNGVGKDDIFRFTRKFLIDSIAPTPKIDPSFDIFLAVNTYEMVYANMDNPNSDRIGRKKLGDVFLKLVKDDGTQIDQSKSNESGLYIKQLADKRNLVLTAAKPGFLNKVTNISVDQLTPKSNEKSVTISLDILLDKIFEDQEVNIPNIYYAYDKWELKSESLPVLDSLVKILDVNPQVQIELFSHTDCRGDDDYNTILSQRRAQSVVNYLVSKGINLNRLKAIGMGETMLVERCECLSCTEAQHQANRRTSFKIRSVKKP